MKIQITDEYYISDFVPDDKDAFLLHFKEKAITETTGAIPFPYTEKDADWWLAHIAEETRSQGRAVNWAIREASGGLIGAVGFSNFALGKSHKAELGYWLAKPYWGRGIMSGAVARACAVGFSEFKLVRITAPVFTFNPASAKVLENNGFAREGLLKKEFLKDGRYIDCFLYAKLIPE